ncbi:hypothetical protein PHMEG_00020232 [Phytophthora megakarya]|uniref:Retrotransposon gag domain-containing protein n=1 Tax=Phytophthora megakarya TaxID=4795 RepID=A0A225VRF1_9STRA|nr:hypothetical protein PHMEG_00020232 [Phytophthora megakarya]
MKGSHTPPNEWCVAFQLSLRDGRVHCHQALSRKTKRTWSLMSDKFISYYCSQFGQSASTRYYRTKRMEKENIRDFLNRLNGYACNANIKFENGGRNAREHVKHFLETCGDKDLEHVVHDILKVEKRVSGREASKYSSQKDEKRYGDSRNSYGRSDSHNRTHDRSRSKPRSTRVALADATLSDLISELQVRTPQEDVNDYSEEIPACTDETIGYEQNKSDANISRRKKSRLLTLMMHKMKALSQLRTTTNVE